MLLTEKGRQELTARIFQKFFPEKDVSTAPDLGALLTGLIRQSDLTVAKILATREKPVPHNFATNIPKLLNGEYGDQSEPFHHGYPLEWGEGSPKHKNKHKLTTVKWLEIDEDAFDHFLDRIKHEFDTQGRQADLDHIEPPRALPKRLNHNDRKSALGSLGIDLVTLLPHIDRDLLRARIINPLPPTHHGIYGIIIDNILNFERHVSHEVFEKLLPPLELYLPARIGTTTVVFSPDEQKIIVTGQVQQGTETPSKKTLHYETSGLSDDAIRSIMRYVRTDEDIKKAGFNTVSAAVRAKIQETRGRGTHGAEPLP